MQRDTDHLWDVIIIGGSAAGLSAALMVGRARRSVLVIDDGLPRNRFADHMHGVLGHDGRTPAELIDLGRAEARAYGVEIVTGRVHDVATSDRGVRVSWAGDHVAEARSVILATGITDELLPIPGRPNAGPRPCFTARTVTAGRFATNVLACSRQPRRHCIRR